MSLDALDAQREFPRDVKRLIAVFEATEADEARMLVVGVEHREISPGHVVAEVVWPLVGEGSVSFDRQLAWQVCDLLVRSEALDLEIEWKQEAKSRADGLS
ncbi:hypothetical protein GHJ84_06030 [Sinorhizobium meliloti]|nr:hypothetical protein [Sinorhizobium meliloti]MQV61180.1 hypothetical protein [Sinorhizobium meliloti]MQX20566.1 hypothetical protein [Sinorhizobium meliloti]RVG76588.1 hypothetical protein CN223_19205 [Sinorhizobium meliloti]RVQ49769.1 hypothetical protein CN245_28550 [Sinorhizobium meliloti]